MTERVGEQAWRRLGFLNGYRLCLAGVLAAIALVGHLPSPFGAHDPGLFRMVAGGYLVACIAALAMMYVRRPGFAVQVTVHILVDIFALTLLMHASGGVSSGLGMLLIIAVAGGSLLTEGRTARVFAAVAALAVLTEQAWAWLAGAPPTSYTHAGLLGASFFATAILAHSLARRLRESEALAERRGLDLANMAQLTEYVIQRMQTGILVLDRDLQTRLVNESALRLLGAPSGGAEEALDTLSPALALEVRGWRDGSPDEARAIRPSPTGPEVLPRFARLGPDRDAGTLVFLEDMGALAQQAQQLKLASLGRLTAGIAHEVRNPLGAISHASQLLAESPALEPGDHRLTEIIQQQSGRVNTIIENILQLSRGSPARPEEVALRPWLEQFVEEFEAGERIGDGRVHLRVTQPDLHVQVDPSQLRQILWNLCQNGLIHGRGALGLSAGIDPESRTPFVEVRDGGPGVDPEAAQHIFEPFFTTSPNGTGMGLYIARELCMSNQARLNCLPADGHGGRFRITFADPRRRQVA